MTPPRARARLSEDEEPLSYAEPLEVLDGSLTHLRGLQRSIQVEIEEARNVLADLERCRDQLAPLIEALRQRVAILKARGRWRDYSNEYRARKKREEEA